MKRKFEIYYRILVMESKVIELNMPDEVEDIDDWILVNERDILIQNGAPDPQICSINKQIDYDYAGVDLIK